MAIFKKNDVSAQKPRERVALPTRAAQGEAISIIATGMTIVGDVTTEGVIRIEGEVHGTIRAGKAVVLGQGGRVEGDIHTEDAVIGGRVSGSIEARSRVELQSTCTVSGEIRTRSEHLKLEEGARFAGNVQMIEGDTPSHAGDAGSQGSAGGGSVSGESTGSSSVGVAGSGASGGKPNGRADRMGGPEAVGGVRPEGAGAGPESGDNAEQDHKKKGSAAEARR